MPLRPSRLLLLVPLLHCAACASDPKPQPRAQVVTPVLRDVPSSLRGTIGAECSVNGIQPALVSGLGFVVGLNGTGGLALDAGVASTMERELGLRGISRGGNATGRTAIDGVSPRELLRDPNTAVVTVFAAIPPGAPKGATFDVYVRALNATSLEGGTLWTTDLRLGEPTTFGGYQTLRLAMANGDIFVNPFVDPLTAVTGPGQAVGRVLAGGIVDSPLKLELALDNESAGRTRSIVSAINSRFPSGSHGQTARGRAAGSIALTVPTNYTQRSADFLRLVLHLPIDQTNLDAYARAYTRVMKNEPQMAEEMMWCLRAIGERSLPFVRELYEDPELVPRMASLTVGAALGDSRAAEHLLRIAKNAPNAQRIEALTLLKTIDAGPTLDLAIREFLSDPELTVRVAAYETLAARAEATQYTRATSRDRSMSVVEETSDSRPTVTQVLSGASIQGVDRRIIGDKFAVDRVPGGRPLVYVTQQRAPRVVIFGDDPKVTEGSLASIWSDRLMLMSESPGQDPRVYYRDARTGRVTQAEAPSSVASLVEFFGRKPTPGDPRPGLDLSYSEVVGALHGLQAQGAINAAFATERDRLMAMLLDANRQALVEERPETASDAVETVFFEAPGSEPIVERGATPTAPPKPVPINPPTEQPKR